MKRSYGNTIPGSFESCWLACEALKNGLLEDAEADPQQLLVYLEKYHSEKASLLSSEVLHVGDNVLVAEIEQRPELFGADMPPAVMAYSMNNSFYPMFVLSINNLASKNPFTAFFKGNEISYKDFRKSKFVFAVYSKLSKQWIVKNIDLSKLPDLYWTESEKWYGDNIRCADINRKISEPDHSLGFWPEAKLYAESVMRPNIAARNAFYFQRVEREFWMLLGIWHNLNKTEHSRLILEELAELKSKSSSWDISSPQALYLQAVDEIIKDPNSFLKSSIQLSNRVLEEGKSSLGMWLEYFLRLCIWSPTITANGTRIPTITHGDPIILEYIELSSDLSSENREEYYETISFEMPWYFRETIGSGNIQVEKSVFKANFPSFCGDLADAKQAITDHLNEAVGLKQFVIPFGGFFSLDGAVSGVKLFEIGQDVFCVFTFNNGRYIRFTISPSEKNIMCPPDYCSVGFEAGNQMYLRNKIDEIDDPQLIALLFLVSAIIRDAWVMEVRESVFGQGVQRRKVSPLLGDRRKPIIVYLPRIKYITNGDRVSEARAELNYVKRRQHFVGWHFRNAVKASPQQFLLAQKIGVYIPEGKTFVRGHQRGQLAAERIYRSRSALQCLRSLEGVGLGRDGWFNFEKCVKQWLEGHNFKVDHVSASRNGDGGIDIQASKGSENLLIQCKYWKNPVGLNVVREMMGSLITFPAGSRGVIVTSSELTIPAKELAIDHNIMFIENVCFDKAIEKDINRGS